MARAPPVSDAFRRIASFENLLAAWRAAARGKRGRLAAAAFEHGLADRLLELRAELLSGRYRPGPYVHFLIHEPKRRKISAAPFRDRVVHHALCRVIEPRFERSFIADSYANRRGKGTHRAVDRLQALAARHRYCLRADVVQFFPSIDHAVLREVLAARIPEPDVMALVDAIIASGDGVLDEEYRMAWFPGDDLLAVCRPRGLPIGNLTSQFWANCYLHGLDIFVRDALGCRAYLRYVDDLALFSDHKRELWDWKRAIIAALEALRLRIHEHAAQVTPTGDGIPWLGFVVHPTHRRVKARKVVAATRRLDARAAQYQDGRIDFAALDASVRGWVNHVRHAQSHGLRRHVLGRLRVRPPDSEDLDGEAEC